MILTTLLFSALVFANEPVVKAETTTTQAEQVEPVAKTLNKMTVKDAKSACKEEGKTGKDLLECIKAKKSK